MTILMKKQLVLLLDLDLMLGRLDDASLACELLMTDDEEEAAFLAEQVEHFNGEEKIL